MAAGEPIDESFLRSMYDREFNSHGGLGIGASHFTKFWEAYQRATNS